MPIRPGDIRIAATGGLWALGLEYVTHSMWVSRPTRRVLQKIHLRHRRGSIHSATNCHSGCRARPAIASRGRNTLLSADYGNDRSQAPTYHHQLRCHGLSPVPESITTAPVFATALSFTAQLVWFNRSPRSLVGDSFGGPPVRWVRCWALILCLVGSLSSGRCFGGALVLICCQRAADRLLIYRVTSSDQAWKAETHNL